MLNREEIAKKIGGKTWVSPYERIVAVADERNGKVQMYEDHARGTCYGGAAWEVHHYKHTSAIVEDAVRDGARNVFTMRIGEGELKLVPSFAGAGIEKVEVTENETMVTCAGLAGGGVAVALARGLAPGPKGVDIHSMGGGSQLGRATLIFPRMNKITVGVDDTDKGGEGATWGLCNEIGYEMGQREGIEYLHHTILQLYPYAPNKTTNCVSIALTFGVLVGKEEEFLNDVKEMLRERTVSDETSMAIWKGIVVPDELRRYADAARTRIVTVEEARKVAEELDMRVEIITGELGTIGAIAALGYAERTEEAVIPGIPFGTPPPKQA